MKIVSTGKTLSSPAFHEKKRKYRHARLKYLCTGLVILIALLIIVSRLESLQVSEINIAGAKTVPHEEIEKVIRDELSGHYMALVPRSNFVAYPGQEITELLLRRFPRFNSVDLQLEGTQTLNISVTEREPFALYCANVLMIQDTSDCYFLDENGFIFDKAPLFSGAVYFVYAATTPIEEPLGKEFLTPVRFRPLVQFVNNLRELGISPVAMEVGRSETNIIISQGGRIIWRTANDLSRVYANLKAFMESDSIAGDPNFLQNLWFIDLRTENKVFYRFRE
jgi:hypothetical protein